MKIFSPTIINNFTASIGVVQGISGSQFSGSFIGDGSGLTGISATIPSGLVSGSAQIDHDQTTNFDANEHFLQSAITTVGTVTVGSVTAILPSGIVSGSSQVYSIVSDLNLFTSSIQLQINSVTQTTGSLNTFTGSALTRFARIESTTGSLNLFTGSANTRFGLIEIKTGSYATTGSNRFIGNQIISGSTIFSGSVYLVSGSFSGSFIGNGSGLTGITTTLPSGVVSGSAQISAFGYINQSQTASMSVSQSRTIVPLLNETYRDIITYTTGSSDYLLRVYSSTGSTGNVVFKSADNSAYFQLGSEYIELMTSYCDIWFNTSGCNIAVGNTGMKYYYDDGSTIAANDRSIPDVGTIRTYLTASAATKTLQKLTTISTSTYTLKTSDWNQALKFDSGSGIIVVTIPSSSVSSSAPMDFVDSFQWNAARIQFTTASNFITLRSSNGFYTRTTGSACSLINMGADQWLLTGDLATT